MIRPILLLIVASSSVLGQDSLMTEAVLIPDRAIKLSPFHLMNFYPSLQVSYEHAVGARTTLQAEAGYVMEYIEREDFQNRRGAKTRLEIRQYLEGVEEKRKLYYMAAELYGNFVNFERADFVVDCFDLECNHTFTQQRYYKVRYREQGLNLKVGMLRYFRMETRVFLDMSLGVTLRRIRYHKPAPEGTFRDVFFFSVSPNEENRFAGRPYMGLRLGYRLK